MPDPFTSLSLAAAIVQFVDFGSRLLVEGYGVYKSTEGAPQGDIDTQELAKDLETLCEQLATLPPANAVQYSRTETQLQSVARKCQELSRGLFDLLDALKVNSTGLLRGWDAVRQAVKRTWKQGRIDQMRKELSDVRAQVNTHLLAIIRNSQSSVMSSLSNLTERNEILHIETETHLRQMRSSLLTAVQDQERAIKMLERARKQQSDAYVQALASYEDTLKNLSLKLDALIKGGDFIARSQKILESLMFTEMLRRHSDIANAYNETFGWIFDDSSTTFKKWLSSESGIFWINGKAGSGKSTLMKFLSDHPDSESILSDWAKKEKKKIICASFYFWSSGHPMERTQQGLLQSLLSQILRKCPHLIPHTFPDRWNDNQLSDRYPKPWTRAELSSAMAKIIESREDHLSSRFCFFIDGLDEYEGDRHQLVVDLKTLSRSTSVKLCVSSRPWTEFKDAFGNDENRMLILQDLTRGDMDRFVRNMLEKDKRFVQMIKKQPNVRQFIEEILDKAQGVFLWVFLVVRSLLRGLGQHDDITILEKRLSQLPSELEEYFAGILDSIEDVYQEHAARLFHLMLRAAPLPLAAFWYLPREMEDPAYVLKKLTMPITDGEAEEQRVEAEQSINAWCRDLLEVRTERPSPIGFTNRITVLHHRVHFSHRTVRDFLQVKHTQDLLDARIKSEFSPWLSLVRLHLFEAKSLTIRKDDNGDMRHFSDVADNVMFFAKQCEVNTNKCPVALIDELDRVGIRFGEIHSAIVPYRWYWTIEFAEPECDFMAYAVSFDLALYVRQAFFRNPQLTKCTRSRLLLPALEGLVEHDPLIFSHNPSLSVVEILLEKGADPNHALGLQGFGQPAQNATPWQRFLWRCHEERRPEFWPVARLLLLNGADTDVKVYDRDDDPMIGDYTDARRCLRSCFRVEGREEMEQLLDTAPTRKGLVARGEMEQLQHAAPPMKGLVARKEMEQLQDAAPPIEEGLVARLWSVLLNISK